MASTRLFSITLLIAFSFFFLLSPSSNAHSLKACHLDQIYQLGDSISDTGNLIREPFGSTTPFAKLPYGMTFFKKATGRCSNGLLMIDYIANAAGLPLLNPYKNMDANFRHGVNFAVAGSTALSTEHLASKNIVSPVTTSSLGIQLDWMTSHFSSICYSERDCVEKLKNSLFMVGEIGGNDYNYALLQGKSIEQVMSMVPEIVQEITDAIKRVISHGAVRIIVPGNFPIGCLPIYLTAFNTNATQAYDEHRCLRRLNDFAKYHNNHLQEAIEELRKEFSHVNIVYGDYYNAYKWLLKNFAIFGFDLKWIQKSCCGTGGDYNFNLDKMCGEQDVPICSNPDQYISWDGIHSTQRAYKLMAYRMLRKMLPELHCGV
ncbi:acetylajmalan esterase-like [Diospyros lotus]|uniref:acetylajmalan esterase-like n=1 Tax=Diospyros lotus TaxID=55363 RepID=UPI00224F48DD|nr:acetylajmalan esterase-like [Diospyros lotus]